MEVALVRPGGLSGPILFGSRRRGAGMDMREWRWAGPQPWSPSDWRSFCLWDACWRHDGALAAPMVLLYALSDARPGQGTPSRGRLGSRRYLLAWPACRRETWRRRRSSKRGLTTPRSRPAIFRGDPCDRGGDTREPPQGACLARAESPAFRAAPWRLQSDAKGALRLPGPAFIASLLGVMTLCVRA